MASPAVAIAHSAVWPTSGDLGPSPRYVLGRGRTGGWQSSGGRNQLLLCNFLVCSANQSFFTLEENNPIPGPLASIFVPDDQLVTLGPLSTPYAFKIVGTELFLNVTPDYEVQAVGWMECTFMGTYMAIYSPNLGKSQRRRG